MKTPSLLLLLLLPYFLFGFYSSAQPLDGLDPTFANNGIYVGDTGGYGRVIVQPDNKIVVTGQIIINGSYVNVAQRFNNNGTIDNGFANNGQFRPDALGFNFVSTQPICVQPDGKILIGGNADTGITNGDFLLIRLKQDGSLDSSFGGGGYIIPPYITAISAATYETIRSIALQPDGKIVAYGLIDFASDTLQVMRFLADGKIDSSFGINGRAKVFQDIDYPTARDIAVMQDGRIVLGAETNIGSLGGATTFTAIRLLPNGELDTSFNNTGIAYTNNNLPGLLYCKAMCLQPDGKVLLTGYADSIAIVRFDTFGKLDNSFGRSGVAKIAPGDGSTIELQPDGKILIAGRKHVGAPNTPGVAMYRLLSDGSLDHSFGVNGEVYDTTYLHYYSDLALQPDQKILICGASRYNLIPNNQVAALVRFMPDATTAVTDLISVDNVAVFPNPASNNIYIEYTTKQRITQILLYSLDGKLLIAQRYPYINSIDLKGLADGIYYLKINFSDNQQITKKIVVQNNP